MLLIGDKVTFLLSLVGDLALAIPLPLILSPLVGGSLLGYMLCLPDFSPVSLLALCIETILVFSVFLLWALEVDAS